VLSLSVAKSYKGFTQEKDQKRLLLSRIRRKFSVDTTKTPAGCFLPFRLRHCWPRGMQESEREFVRDYVAGRGHAGSLGSGGNLSLPAVAPGLPPTRLLFVRQ
jgi:hypothetical protein